MVRSHRVKIVTSLVAGAAMFLVAMASASIPRQINYQGRLIDGVAGLPLAGSHTLAVSIYDDPSAGNLLWSETKTVEADSGGVFATILGSVDPIDVAFDVPCWLEIEADGEILSPRRELASVPYAFQAEDASHASAADSLGGYDSGQFVLKGETASITATMIVAGAGSGLDADKVDGQHADAFADTTHQHDERYFTKAQLNASGTVNEAGNPVDWTKLKSVPAGFVDGVDNVGAGDGYSLDAADGNPVDAVYVNNTGDVRINGKLGIGTASPAAKLDVNGDINTGSTYMIGGVTMLAGGPGAIHAGEGAGGPGSVVSVAVGDSAGHASYDDFSTFVGDHAGYMSGDPSNPAGNNTFIGSYAASKGNKAYGNTFVGASAGRQNSTGGYNTFVGASAGVANTNGSTNTFLGVEAGRDNEGGFYNTFLGSGTGLFNMSGNNNTMIGTDAGHDNKTGSGNVFLGYQAGYRETSSNKLCIANGPDSANVFLYGQFDTYNRLAIGVGCLSPLSTITVNDNIHRVAPAVPAITVGNYQSSAVIALGSDADNCGGISWYHPNFLNIFTSKRIGFNVGNSVGGDSADVMLDENGDLGIGTTAPAQRLHIVGENPRILIEATSTNAEVNFKNTGDTGGQVWALYKDGATDDFRFYQNGDRVNFQSSTGNVAIGAIDPAGYRLYVAGTAYATGSWQSSDLRLKADLRGIGDALGKVLRLNGVSFRWRTEDYADRGLPEGRHYGLVAQEVEEVLPEIVGNGPDGEKALAYTELIPVLVEAVKELKAESDQLRADNESLRQRLEALEGAGGR